MSILGESHSTSVYGGIFNATTYQSIRPWIDNLMEAVSPNAFYDSDNRADSPKCHPNTRIAVINKISDWANGMIDTNAFMLWLYGPAGAGKTAIARKVAELFAEKGLLLASFLFFRSDPNRNTMKPLVANIAYRVAFVIPGARKPIDTVIESDPLILSYSVEMQLKKLVFEPLQLLVYQGYFSVRQFPRLVVIDGLDECLDKDSQTNLVQLLSSSVARYQLPLKFLIVSRPESHIKSAITIAGEQSAVSHLELNNDFLPEEDIRCFLTDKFREIKRCHLFRSRIPSLWPSKQQMDTLIRKASGQFIYASLAVRFINSTCNSPMRQLDIVLELRPPINHDLPFAELDTLFALILSCTKSLDLVLRILGLYDVLIKDHSENVLEFVEFVLCLEDGDVCIYLSPLNSLLEVRESSGYGYRGIIFHHPSFMDFLHSPERSRDYCIDAQKSHFLIAQRILQLFTSDGPSACRQAIDERWFGFIDLVEHLTKSFWTLELEHALQRFSIRTYLDWFDQLERHFIASDEVILVLDDEFPEWFLNYLKVKGKSGLYHQHCLRYLEHVMSSINSPSTREKFCLMRTVMFIIEEPFKSLCEGVKLASWTKFCAILFKFNSAELILGKDYYEDLFDPEFNHFGAYGNFDETKRFVPEPILSHRLASVAISCMQYLHRWDSNTSPTRDHFLASWLSWATKSKQSPWLWRRRMRVASMGRRQRVWNHNGHNYSFPLNLRRTRQIFYSETIQSEDFYQKQRIFYTWTLDLLYHTLRKAMKSDELTRALSKPFIPSLAPLLFPRRVKRVRKAAAAYLKKFSPSSLDASSMEAGVRRSMRRLPHSNMIAIYDDKPESSRKVFLTGRDATEKDLKQNIDNMLDAIYCSTGADPKILASVSDMFDQVNKLGTGIGTRQTS